MLYIGGENMLKVITGEAEISISCYDDQICAGLKAVIEGVIHDVKYLWDKNPTMENWGLLLVDAKKAFNKINRVGMLWTGKHLQPSGDRFVIRLGKLVRNMTSQQLNKKNLIVNKTRIYPKMTPRQR